MVWLPDNEKIVKIVVTRFDRIHEHDGQTDGQTPRDGIGRAYAASRFKNVRLHGIAK